MSSRFIMAKDISVGNRFTHRFLHSVQKLASEYSMSVLVVVFRAFSSNLAQANDKIAVDLPALNHLYKRASLHYTPESSTPDTAFQLTPNPFPPSRFPLAKHENTSRSCRYFVSLRQNLLYESAGPASSKAGAAGILE